MTQGKSNRFYTGVSLEPEVNEYLKNLATRMGMSHSWVLNTIVYEYARFVEHRNIIPGTHRLAAERATPAVISA